MAYFTKKEVLEYAEKENKKAEERNLKPLTPFAQTLEQLELNEEIVGFFWVNVTEGESMNLEGKTFVKIDNDIYTDDRFAIDLFQAQKEGILISDVIKSRSIKDNLDINKGEVEQKIKDVIKKK